MDKKQMLTEAYEQVLKVFALMVQTNSETPTRNLSTAITYLETAMMWLNKDRAARGFLEKNNTHMEVTNA